MPFLRYVIQKHWTDPLHYDLMFEKGDFLETYSISEAPTFQNFESITIRKIQPHRLLYLTYEGPISGNRGTVEIWDQGFYSWPSFEEELLFLGNKLQGVFRVYSTEESVSFTLTRIKWTSPLPLKI